MWFVDHLNTLMLTVVGYCWLIVECIRQERLGLALVLKKNVDKEQKEVKLEEKNPHLTITIENEGKK